MAYAYMDLWQVAEKQVSRSLLEGSPSTSLTDET